MRRSGFLGGLTALAVGAAVLSTTAAAGATSAPGLRCRDRSEGVHDLNIQVEGEPAHGLYSVPQRKARGLVVFAHGYGHTSVSWVGHMREAARHGLIAVTMNYRGLEVSPDANEDGLPESRGFPIMTGSEDSIAAARAFERRCRPETVTIMGVSLGGNISGIAVAESGERGVTRSDGTPLWDYWVDVEGEVNLVETYLEARAAEGINRTAANARVDIEQETGGPIDQVPDEYLRRTVVARGDDIRRSGIQGAVVIHGLDDGLVPYNQGREMTTVLRGVGVPTEMSSVGLRDQDSERETTLTGHAVSQINPDYISPLAGHSSETSTTHIVMETALERLWSLMAGEAPADRECLVNGGLDGGLRRTCTP